jgi:hypothetical protein
MFITGDYRRMPRADETDMQDLATFQMTFFTTSHHLLHRHRSDLSSRLSRRGKVVEIYLPSGVSYTYECRVWGYRHTSDWRGDTAKYTPDLLSERVDDRHSLFGTDCDGSVYIHRCGFTVTCNHAFEAMKDDSGCV